MNKINKIEKIMQTGLQSIEKFEYIGYSKPVPLYQQGNRPAFPPG